MGYRIIIEGVDGSGKTTLAKILADKYGLDYCHCGVDDPCDFDFYKQTSRKNNIVWDRHTLGELIYPRVFDRKIQCGQEDCRIVLSLARQDLNAKIFVLTADLDVLKARLEARGNEHPAIMKNLKWIDDQFRFYAEGFRIPIIDTSKMSLDDIFKMIEKEK